MPTVTFTANALVTPRGFTADGYITGNRLRHDRTLDHSGVQPTDVVVLSVGIGPYPAGTTVQVVLADFALRLGVLEAANRVFATFRVDAFIRPTFRANAVLRRSVSGSFTANAVKTLVGAHSFTADAAIFRSGTVPGPDGPHHFTANAFLV